MNQTIDLSSHLPAGLAGRAGVQGAQERLLNALGVGVHWIGLHGEIVFENTAAVRLLGWESDELIGQSAHDTMHHTRADGTVYPRCECKIYGCLQTGVECQVEDEVFWRKDGTSFPVDYISTPLRNEEGIVLGVVVVFRDITKRKAATAELKRVHRELLDVSWQAGMAEISTTVLHNVGNVLNSVNIASAQVAESVRHSKAASLSRVVQMLKEHENDLASFLDFDPIGRQLPAFLGQLAERWEEERMLISDELSQMQEKIEHLKEIIALQQGSTRASEQTEPVRIAELLDEAVGMSGHGREGREVTIIRQYAEVPALNVNRHKTLQIFVNLLCNARQASMAGHHPSGPIVLAVSHGQGAVNVAITDRGVGIAPAKLQQIFDRGFTTKVTGHGYGLHSSALLANELGGCLRAESPGLGRGATFILELPIPGSF